MQIFRKLFSSFSWNILSSENVQLQDHLRIPASSTKTLKTQICAACSASIVPSRRPSPVQASLTDLARQLRTAWGPTAQIRKTEKTITNSNFVCFTSSPLTSLREAFFFLVFHPFWLLSRRDWGSGCRLLSGCMAHKEKPTAAASETQSQTERMGLFGFC